MIMRFNRWYDKISEPYRMLVGLGIASPVFILLAMPDPALICSGLIYAMFLIIVRIIGAYNK